MSSYLKIVLELESKFVLKVIFLVCFECYFVLNFVFLKTGLVVRQNTGIEALKTRLRGNV